MEFYLHASNTAPFLAYYVGMAAVFIREIWEQPTFFILKLILLLTKKTILMFRNSLPVTPRIF